MEETGKKDQEKRRGKMLSALGYIWDYYKLHLFLFGLCLYCLFYWFYRGATDQNPLLYLAYVNLEVGDTLNDQLTGGFLSYVQPSEKNSVVKTLPNLMLSEKLLELDSSLLYASQMKILSAIDSEKLDLVLMNQEAFDAFSQNGYLIDMESFLENHDFSFAKPFLAENLEILTDNATEALMDPSVAYQSQVTSYYMGLDVSACPAIKKAGFPDQVYLGIIANTPREDMAASYISYLWGQRA